MTTRWGTCITCKKTYKVALNVNIEDYVCDNCKTEGQEDKKLYEQPLPKIKKKDPKKLKL